MCGIAGIFTPGRPADEAALRVMLDCLRHRGPDDEGIHREPGLLLASRRLSVIDLSGGHQPIDVGDGVVVSQNGEIYNFPELREELERAGEQFRTRSDTEVIGRLYRRHGPGGLRRLSGMFAVAIYDGRTRELVLARDRSGIKPLYVADVPGGVAYASELSALRAAGLVVSRPCEAALRTYAYFGFVAGRESALEGARRLGPGEAHIFAADARRAYRFAEPYEPRERAALVNPERDLMFKLGAAAERHLLSDVPVGVFLSGGLDSSALVALLAQRGVHLKTFSIGPPSGGNLDERPLAALVARHFGCEHHSAELPVPCEASVRELAACFDEPFADSSAFATLALSRLARQHVTVALSGTGGDETLSGYDRYALPRLFRRLRYLPGPLARGLATAIRRARPTRHSRFGERWIRVEKLLRAIAARRSETAYAGTVRVTPDLWGPLCGRSDEAAEALAQDVLKAAGLTGPAADLTFGPAFDHRVYLPDDLLVKEDRTSMAVSLEARVPFLDTEWLRWTELVGEGVKRAGGGKALLRRALRELLPPEVLRRPKHGFAMPVTDWMRSDGMRWAGDVLAESDGQSGFDAHSARRLFESNRRGEADAGEALWAALMLELWHRNQRVAAARAETAPLAPEIRMPAEPARMPRRSAASRERVKVVRIISRMNVGGPAIHVSLLTAGLREYGFDTILVKGRESRGEGSMDDVARRYGVSPITLPGLRRELQPLDDLRALAGLVALLRRERPSIVHTHTSKAGILGRLAARAAGVPVVVHTYHGHVLDGYFHPLIVKGIIAAERILARSSTRLIAVSQATAADMRRLGVARPEQLLHIPLGLPIDPLFHLERGRGEFRAQLGVAPSSPLVGIVARLAEVKRHEVFLQAAARVLKTRPDVRFAVVGGGEREPLLRSLARGLGVEAAVHFTGFRRDLEVVLSDLDVSVLCSRSEGLPVAVIEAMAAGVPVASTDVGGVRELLGDDEAGLLVRSEDPEGLAAAILRLLSDRELSARLVARARKRAEAYREERLLAAIAVLYRELLASAAAPG